MQKLFKVKTLTGIFICAGLAAIIVGAIIFFAHYQKTAAEEKIEPKEPIMLSTVVAIEDKSDIVLCAHRGFSAIAPENTIEAFEAAGEAMFSRVEFDVRETSDGIPVISHDEEINRMTDGSGKVSDYTLKKLLGFTVDNGANVDDFNSVKIPTLSQALRVCDDLSIVPVIEIKKLSDDGLKKTITLIKEAELEGGYIIQSFDADVLEAVAQLDKEAELWLLSSKLNDKAIDFVKENKQVVCIAFDAHDEYNSEDVIAKVVSQKIRLNAWTVDDANTLISLYNLGVREFITNCITPIV